MTRSPGNGSELSHQPQRQRLSSQAREEEKYNRRRQEQLRSSGASNHSQFLQPSIRPQSASHMIRPDGYSLQQQRGSLVEQPPPASHFTLGTQPSIQIPLHIREHISHIQNDNASLMRRLNLVHQELERINRDKGELKERLARQQSQQSEAYDLFTKEDNIDRVNKYMNDDLLYERDRNMKLKQQIQELNTEILQMTDRIREIEREQEQMIRFNQENTYYIQKTLQQISDLEKEQYYNQERIKEGSNNIDLSKVENVQLDQSRHHIRNEIEAVYSERNQLIDRVTGLSHRYDDIVRQLSEERRELDIQNSNHAKFVTSKIIANLLQHMHLSKMQQGFQEILTYTNFDSKCNNKLKSLSKILEKAGNTKLKISLTHWFSCALKPIEIKLQSSVVAYNSGGLSLTSKYYRIWRHKFTQRIDSYESKTRSLEVIWNRFQNEATKEKLRALSIWKEAYARFRLQKYKLKKLFYKKLFKSYSIAISAWRSHNTYFEQTLRMTLLNQKFSQKQYLALILRNFHQETQNKKRRRIQIEKSCLKAWQDYIAYQKYLMSQNLLATKFQIESFTSLIKACFDALKQNKQKKIYQKTYHQLHNVELVKVSQLKEETEYISAQRNILYKHRACQCLILQQQKKLWSYINHWKKSNADYQAISKSSLKDKLIRLFYQKHRFFFNYWKHLHVQSKINQSQQDNKFLQQEQISIQNDVIEMNNLNEYKQNIISQLRIRRFMKCIDEYETRAKHITIGRWKDYANTLAKKEYAFMTLAEKLRIKIIRNGFRRYNEGVQQKKKLETQELLSEKHKKLRERRIVLKIINVIQGHKNNNQKAQDYLERIIHRLDTNTKRQTIVKWRESNQLDVEASLQQHGNDIVETIEDLNHTIGELDKLEVDQRVVLNGQQTRLTVQAQRILSNTILRLYEVKLTRGLEKWKEYVDFELNKKRLLMKALSHHKKNQFYIIKSYLKNWIQTEKIIERTEQLKKETMKANDIIHSTNLQQEHFIRQKLILQTEDEEQKAIQKTYNIKLQKLVQLIVKRVNQNHYTSQRRYIFLQWSDYAKRQVYFINCMKKVLSKSLQTEGFQAIKFFCRESNIDDNMTAILINLKNIYYKNKCRAFLSYWRGSNFFTIKEKTQNKVDKILLKTENHKFKKETIKEHNSLRAEKLIRISFLRNMIKAWRNVVSYLKVRRDTTNLCSREVIDQTIKNTLTKWRQRKAITRKMRASYQRASQMLYSLRTRQCFMAILDQNSRQKELASRLSNLALILNQQQLQNSWEAIKSYGRAKKFVFDKRKQNATIWFSESLELLFQTRKQNYFTELRKRCLNKKRVDLLKLLTVTLTIRISQRHFFQQWREKSNKASLSKELYEEGPVRMQEVALKSDFLNIKDFMAQEGYDEKDIDSALFKHSNQQKQLIFKTIKRLQHFNNPNYMKPKVLDRWKRFVNIKKLFRYYLRFVEKRSLIGKSDIHYAFDRWKYYYPANMKELTVLSKTQLNQRTVVNNKVLDSLAEHIQEKENMIDHLNAQRDTLLDNYIKAQKLVLSMWSNNYKNAMHQSFLKWHQDVCRQKKFEAQIALKTNLNTLEQLKMRITDYEDKNEVMALENEELRQFSLDGYEIAKNVQALSTEREILSVDLADKANVIKKLLDENEMLTRKLQQAQEHAQTLIRSTMRMGNRPPSSGYSGLGRSIRS